MAEIKPLLLVPENVSVELNMICSHIQTRIPALVKLNDHAKSSFTINVFESVCSKLFKSSWLKDKISYEEFLCGIVLHEVSHIRYGTFSIAASNADSAILAYIDNVFEDSRIEYSVSREFPSYAKYIHYVLSAIKPALRKSYESSWSSAYKKSDHLQQTLSTVFRIVRFGVVDDDDDDGLVNFVLPLSLASKRGNRRGCFDVSCAVFNFIRDNFGISSTADASQELEFLSVTRDEIENVGGNSKVADSQVADVISSSKDIIGALPASGKDKLEIVPKDDQFFRQTCEKFASEIQEIRKVFKRIFEKTVQRSAFDGDLNIMRQQQAYIDSFSQDERKNYLVRKKAATDMDLVVVRDVSISTANMSVDYAHSVVCFLAALHKISGIRTAEIDFNTTPSCIMKFDDDITKSRIYPNAAGGTCGAPALRFVQSLDWQAITKICIIITDGQFSDKNKTEVETKKLNMDGIKTIFVHVSSEKTTGIDLSFMKSRHERDKADSIAGNALNYTTVRELPRLMSSLVLKEFGV